MKEKFEYDEVTGKSKDFPITHGKLTNLMKHVDESFPKVDWGEEFDILKMDAFMQWSWARSQEWMTCLEELADILATPILTNSQLYFISDEFRDSDDAKQGA